MKAFSFRRWKSLAAIGCAGAALTGPAIAEVSVPAGYLDNFKPITEQVVQSKENAVTPDKVKLGKMLYYDPRLSKSGLLSCNTCHNIAMYGVSALPTDIGHKWAIGPINGPTVMNSAYNLSQFWDGRAKDLEEQAKGPILNPAEMGMPSEAAVVERIGSITEYRDMFTKSFPGEKLTYNNIAKAIAAFERTLQTPSRFDRFLTGDANALTDQEKNGLKLFVENGCAACHNGVAIGGNSFQKMGVVKPYKTDNKARGKFDLTKKKEDMNVFKVPTLRNVERTYPYFHDGMVWELENAVKIMGDVQTGKKLNDTEASDIAAFLRSLTGTIPAEALQVPVLPASEKGTPRPSAD
ncbi:MAG: cytochrome-c peroxidase [Deltaproteobacteria bacterium]|nr:cytochrome-c peroxidase [Deltaproteobacteria bacterium]MBZ0219903.1 cytochrome-c peroxidase [Deltaproteobacteria bacterium]